MRNKKIAAFTFDDGPSLYTEQFLEILSHYAVRATFFVVGSEAEKYPELIRQIHKEGHVLGNHTWSHPDIRLLPSKILEKQIASTNAIVKRLTGVHMNFFRPPYGVLNNLSLKVIRDSRMLPVLWNVDGDDWIHENAIPFHERILARMKERSLILVHDGDAYGSGPRGGIIHSLPVLIEELKKQDFQFVTVSDFINHSLCSVNSKSNEIFKNYRLALYK